MVVNVGILLHCPAMSDTLWLEHVMSGPNPAPQLTPPHADAQEILISHMQIKDTTDLE